MIDLPLGKALVAAETEVLRPQKCRDCVLISIACKNFYCDNYRHNNRKDGKNVIFKIVDYPVLPEKTNEGDNL